MPVARLPPQIALSGESATTVTERSWEYLWLTPGRSLLSSVSLYLPYCDFQKTYGSCTRARLGVFCLLLPQSPLMGGPRVGATSNPLPVLARHVAKETLAEAADGKCFALLDRNVVSNPWRKVWVVRHAATADEPAHFKCYFEESGDVIDEPENGVVKAIHCGLAC
mmetsp:Transcript_5117/g.16403  ORF Transcript_5117/g.16403 Transcript_5117/m.16403 type:complete len:166 (+) Transcript_5117:205-702(+)